VIVADPTATPATSPLPFTPAIDDGLLAHVIVRPVSVLPFTSLGVAVSWVVCPTNTAAVAGLTVTEATGTGAAVTVTADVPLFPSDVAVMVVEPATTPVTRPLALTVPTEPLLLAHVTVRPVSVLPFASFGVAVSWTVCPACTDAGAGLTVTDATGTSVTVTTDVPLCPSDVAVIVVEPATTPVTRPLAFTVPTEVLLLAHVTVRPVNGLPFASFGVAVSWTACATGTDADAGLTVTDATGSGPALTVTAELPLCPSDVAVIVVEPATTPVTSPLPSTPPTEPLLLAQVTVRPLRALPFASFGVAASCTVCPTATDADAGLTVTDATGTVTAVTVRVAVPLCPSDVAAIVVEPVAAAVATPLVFTFATV